MDEALEFELGGLGKRALFVDEDLCRANSEGDYEELNELAAKCFNSDPEMHVPLKNMKGIQREKSIVVLSDVLVPKNYSNFLMHILIWNIMGFFCRNVDFGIS